MTPRTWNRVTMHWDFSASIGGIPTCLRLDGEFDPDAFDEHVISYKAYEKVHGLYSITGASQPRDGSRTGRMILEIGRSHGPNVAPNSKAIVKRLTAKFKDLAEQRHGLKYAPRIQPPATESWSDTKFTVIYTMADGEQFCDTTIRIARAVFEGLGVKDRTGYSLACFSVQRDSFVRLDDTWVTFERWLRMSHRLPIYGPEDRS